MNSVRAKKHLGQHFLKDQEIAKKIAQSLTGHGNYQHVLEIGPGMGVLTQYLLPRDFTTWVIEIDRDSISYLKNNFSGLSTRIIEADFLKYPFVKNTGNPVAIIGNLPYNISSQIFFTILENKNDVPEIVGMVQKEVAERLASPPGTKTYGILSVLLQAYYDIDYLFTVEPHVFSPPPKVRSGVIRLKRNETTSLACDERLFKQVVKAGFQMRRKTLRNALKTMQLPQELVEQEVFSRRAETLSVEEFVALTSSIQKAKQ